MSKFIYFRCSTEKQDNERQLFTIKKYLDSINDDINNYQIFSDEGISGGTTIIERQTNEILKQLKKDDLILVVEMSRMSRNFADRVSFIAYCDKLGAKIYNISKNRFVTLNTSDGGIVDIIDSWEDDSFLRNLRTATIQGMKKAKSKGIKIGRANEKYTINECIQRAGRIRASMTRNNKTVSNAEFQSFCRILQRVFKILQDFSNPPQNNSDLIVLYKSRRNILNNTTNENIITIIQQMRNAKADNKDLFKAYPLDNSPHQISVIRSKIYGTFRVIETYIKNNN